MRDDWARLIELERRQRRNQYELNALERTVKQAKEKLRLSDAALPPTIISGGGGGSSNVLRWAKDFCMAVVFDTYPEIDTAHSENPTKDAASLDAAVHALETGLFLPSEIQTGTDPEGYQVTGSQSIYYQDDARLWQYMSIGGSYSANVVDEIESVHLARVGMRFLCGWFPDAAATIETDQTDPDQTQSVANRYVPGANPERAFYTTGDYDSVLDLPSWDSLYGSLRSAELGSIDASTGSIGMGFTTGSAPFNYFYRITKWVSFWTYDDEGLRKALRYIACHHKPYDGDELITPWKFAEGPKRSTVGSYLLPATIGAYGFTIDPTASEFFDALGTAELFVSWGSTCEDAVPPITDETPDDWEDFCAAITAASSTWTKIPGLKVFMNGTEIFGDTLGNYPDPPTMTFEFAPRLQQYLDDNPDVNIYVSYELRCDPGPANMQPTSDVIVGPETELVPPRNSTCAGTKDTYVQLVITMKASPSRSLFDDICCTPYALHCSLGSLVSSTLEYYIDPI